MAAIVITVTENVIDVKGSFYVNCSIEVLEKAKAEPIARVWSVLFYCE